MIIIIFFIFQRNLWDAYKFYKDLAANVDENVSNALDGIEKSFTFVGCVKEEVKDSEKTDRFWALLQSTMACNAEESSGEIRPVPFKSLAGIFNDNNKINPSSRDTLYPHYIRN